MSNARRRPPAGRRPAQAKVRSPWPIVIAGVAVMGVLLIVAIVASSGGDDNASAPGIEETRPVTILGDPLPTLTGGGADPAVGMAAPAVEGATFDGTRLTIGDGPAVVVFLAHWCPHCQAEVPVLVDHFRDNPPPEGVDVVAVATSTTSSRPNYPPSAWLEDEGFDVPTLADDEEYSVASAYGLNAFPYYVVLDGSGEVVLRTSGELTGPQFDGLLAAAGGA